MDLGVDQSAAVTLKRISADCPALDVAYKLTEYAGRPRRKRSSGKQTWPGAKQVFRKHDARGEMSGDLIALADEQTREPGPGEPLLQEVMRDGHCLSALPPLPAIRDYCASRVAELLAQLRKIDESESTYTVEVSPRVQALAAETDAMNA